MPASSRKRNKGRDRKAKQLAKKEENERAEARDFWRSFCGIIQCHHGCDSIISDDHPVSSFMDQFIINAQNKEMTVHQNLSEIFKSHRLIWNNESYRKLAINILTNIGVNLILNGDESISAGGAVVTAKSIFVLERYNGTNDIGSVFDSRVVRSKSRDLYIGNKSIERDILKFFRKRTSCKCLKRMHLEARKSTPKMGICYNCDISIERVYLSTCSRCMVARYCSRQCQVAAWPEHKCHCDMLSSALKKEMRDGEE